MDNLSAYNDLFTITREEDRLVGSTGDIVSKHYTVNYETDSFKDWETAKFWAEKTKFMRELNLFKDEANEKSRQNGIRYILAYDVKKDVIEVADILSNIVVNSICFNNPNDAENAIDIFGEEDLKKYLFGIPEKSFCYRIMYMPTPEKQIKYRDAKYVGLKELACEGWLKFDCGEYKLVQNMEDGSKIMGGMDSARHILKTFLNKMQIGGAGDLFSEEDFSICRFEVQ